MSSQADLNGAANLARSEFDRITVDKVRGNPVQSYFNQESPSSGLGPSPVTSTSSGTQIGFQTTLSPDHAPQSSTALRMEDRYSATPSFPPEASQVKMDTNEDVIRRLKTQISSLKAEKKASRTALDEMLSDLLAAQRDVQDKASIIAAKDAETATFEEEKKQMFQEHMAVRKQFAELSIMFDEKSTKLRAAEMSVSEQKQSAQGSQAKALLLQQEVDHLLSRLNGANVMDRSSAVKAEKLKTEQHLQKLAEVEGRMEQYARDLSDERSRTAQVTQQMRDLEAAQLVAAQNAPDINAMKDMQLKHDTQISEFRRMLKFFKDNSEHLTRELRAAGKEQQPPMPGAY